MRSFDPIMKCSCYSAGEWKARGGCSVVRVEAEERSKEAEYKGGKVVMWCAKLFFVHEGEKTDRWMCQPPTIRVDSKSPLLIDESRDPPLFLLKIKAEWLLCRHVEGLLESYEGQVNPLWTSMLDAEPNILGRYGQIGTLNDRSLDHWPQCDLQLSKCCHHRMTAVCFTTTDHGRGGWK